MSKRYTKEEMAKICADVQDHFAGHVADFPGLAKVTKALAEVAKDPASTSWEKVSKPEPVEKKAVQIEPVRITYKGDEIIVSAGFDVLGGLFWPVKYGIDKVLGIETGKVVDKPGTEYHGNPIYKSTYDKKRKASILPAEKRLDLLKFFKAFGLKFVEHMG